MPKQRPIRLVHSRNVLDQPQRGAHMLEHHRRHPSQLGKYPNR